MPTSFQPKFVDLVRNYTTTVGTADFKLGSVVNGYTGFAAACVVGDQFYYSTIGVDKPAEREVGRGTLLANGIIQREPIGGTKTVFSNGTKSIALIAAAEWFSQANALVGSMSTVGQSVLTAATPADARAALQLSGGFNVKWFGAKGDSNATASIGTDDTAAIQAAINYINTLGGGTLYFPEGYYKVTSYLTLCAKLRIIGAGRLASVIVSAAAGGGGSSTDQNVRNGSILYSNWPSNSSTTADIVVEHLGFINTNAANDGAAFYDNGGTYITLRHCFVSGFKYGAILDQSELCDVYDCNIIPANNSGACVWMVNGATLKAGNSTLYTNRISVKNCQLNAGNTVSLIKGGAGYNYTFQDNNYNGGLYQIDLDGTQNFLILGGEFEGVTSNVVKLVNAASGTMQSVMLPGGGSGAASISGAACNCTFVAVAFTGSAVPVSSAQDGVWTFIGCGYPAYGDYVDNHNCRLAVVGASESMQTDSGTATTMNGDHPGTIIRCTNAAPYTFTLQTDANRTFPIGTKVTLEQTTAAGTATFAGQVGVTITGPTATSGQYQRITARKTAADAWETELSVQDGSCAASLTSGTLPATRMPALTGDVTTAPGAVATTIGAGKVTLAMQANMATASVVYRKTAGSGAPEVQTLATLKADLGLTGTNSGDQTSIVGITGTIAQFNTACTDADFVPTGLATASGLTMSTGKLLGRSTAATGAIEELSTVPAANFPILTGDVTTAGGVLATAIAANVVTYAKFQQIAANALVGNPTGTTATAQAITLAGGLSFSGTTLTAAGALTPISVAAGGAVTSSGGGIGYATGAGGTVTQLTSKATAVTLNKFCGQITMASASLAAAAIASFTLNNSQIAVDDRLSVWVKSGNATAGTYRVWVEGNASGARTIVVENRSAGALSEALVLGFELTKAVTA